MCFNNLTHIVPGALSVLSELLQTFLEALRGKRPHITYAALGEEIALNPGGACFATLDSTLEAPTMSNIDRHLVLNSTMSMLPSDLTRHFRTVSVTSPDFRIAMEIILLSQGKIELHKEIKETTRLLFCLCCFIPSKVCGLLQFAALSWYLAELNYSLTMVIRPPIIQNNHPPSHSVCCLFFHSFPPKIFLKTYFF